MSSEHTAVSSRGMAVVTGAGRGIGRAIATRLGRDGFRVAVVDINGTAATRTRDEIVAGGGRAIECECDVADESAVTQVFADLEGFGDPISTIVTSAGVVGTGATHELTLESWRKLIDVNLTGTFLVCKHGLRAMLVGGGGAIVTIGSVASVVARRGGSAAGYAAAKGGVLQLTRSIAANYADQGIRANCVCPGSVETELGTNSAGLGLDNSTLPSAPAVSPPIARRAQPFEIADAVAFLVSTQASFGTGATLMVDGGLTAV